MAWRLLLGWVLLAGSWTAVFGATAEEDVRALLAIQKGWNGSTIWTGSDPCGANWQGVQCNSDNRVVNLTLTQGKLVGRLLPSIQGLEYLESLDLSMNPGLGGPIPSTLGNLSNLQFLTLQTCSFTGPIPPELGNLSNLEFLGLNMNKLNGTIPPRLGALKNCTWFDLSENNLSGELPVSTGQAGIGLDNLTSAKHFHLNNNSFTGSFPKEITILPNLIHLLLDHNDMEGPIPPEIGNFSKLKILRLDNNRFSGSFPDSITNVSTLQEFHIRNNLFTSIPDLSSVPELLFLSLGMNPYSPQPVPSFGKLTRLQTLEFDHANLTGQLPSELLALSSLETISLDSNHVNGTVNLERVSQNLVLVSLTDNDVENVGQQPGGTSFRMNLAGNPVCGSQRSLPSFIDCSSDGLETWAPGSDSCKLTCSGDSEVNPAACNCAVPLVLMFQFNAPTFLVMTWGRNDALRKKLAAGVGLSENQVWVQNGFFTGNFRFNAHVAFFPSSGQQNFSAEQRTFILSQFVFHRANLSEFDPYHLLLPDLARTSGRSPGGLATGVIVGLVAGIAMVSVALGAAIFFALRQRTRARRAAEGIDPFASWGSLGVDNGEAPVVRGVKVFTVADMKKATNNFSESHEIGFGGYGKVYKGYLLSGETVAIKRAQADSMQGAQQFKNEIEILSRLHHRNLVGLIGFCFDQGEQMLVYEYMANGTIRDHLLANSKLFTWIKRLEVALGAAKGLMYLHDLASPPVIHRDIKSSNILLDENFVAKVADLGLSKVSLADQGKTHVSTQVKGTLGYLDPEYYMTQQLTDKSDVYSFGVVLLELVSARQPIENGKYIVREMKNALARDDFYGLLDKTINWKTAKQLRAYLSLAMRCCDESANTRPSMNEVVRSLEIILSNASVTSSKRYDNDEFHVVNLYDDDRFLGSTGPGYSGQSSNSFGVTNRVQAK